MNVQHIGRVPRVNPVQFPPDHPLVDEFNKPTTWDDGPGCGELLITPWPNKFTEWADSPENFCILRGYQYYVHEWMLRRGQDVKRFVICVQHVTNHFGPGMDPTKIKVAQGKRYEDARYAARVLGGTVMKELRMHLAAMNHNFKRERIDKVPFIEMPDYQASVPRPLSEDEFAKIKRLALPRRRWIFWRVLYHSGHRSRACETLKWAQVDFENRTINFNAPGARKTNKRRADGFPITDEFLKILLLAKKWHDEQSPDDPYVIGLSPKGKCTPTFRGCKKDLKAVGVEERGVCRHSVRKLFCSTRIANGQSGDLVAALIADDPRTMKRHYVKLNSEQMRAAAENRPVESRSA